MRPPLPTFTMIDIATFPTRLDAMLATHLKKIDVMLHDKKMATWDNLMRPLEEMDNELERFWSPLSHLHSVMQTPELRDCFEACLPKLSAYQSSIGQNSDLYQAVKSLDPSGLNAIQQKIVDDALRNFILSGVALSSEDKIRFEAISLRQSELSNQFENHVLDTVNAYELHITDESQLAGLPTHVVDSAHKLAEEKSLTGWMLTLSTPCYLAVATYADNRALRETMYEAYVTRASDQGPLAKKFDNTEIMNEMLALRHEEALLLGFENYAEVSLATKMAESPKHVMDFLQDLVQRARGQAVTEFQALQAYARDAYHIETICPWDIAYLSEKKQEASFSISQELLRPFFPLNQVMMGLFTIVNKLYGMTFEEIKEVDTWHPDVCCYRVMDEEQQLRGYVYVDLFARPNKRSGAWMDSCQSRYQNADGTIQLPIATVTCNFAKTSVDAPPMLSHDEVVTLFHEFGHCLHHILTQVDYLSASGIHGVEWDAVELPSQFFENWCWDEHALQLLTAHVDTGLPLPTSLFKQLLLAKNFQSAMVMMRQLEFSLFDFRIHQEYSDAKLTFISDMLADVRKNTAVVPIVPYNRSQHSFSHIFGGGYAAGYYSYKWAEVLSSDAFARFEKEGVFNKETGRDFLHCVLEQGGSRKAMASFINFRGQPPTVDALLRHNGIF